jgi:hypothetical protein
MLAQRIHSGLLEQIVRQHALRRLIRDRAYMLGLFVDSLGKLNCDALSGFFAETGTELGLNG